MKLKGAFAWTGGVIGVLALIGFIGYLNFNVDPYIGMFEDNCGTCHGDNLQGAPLGPMLVGTDFAHGDSIDDIMRSISNGFPERGMPRWSDSLTQTDIKGLAIYISERRMNMSFTDFRNDMELVVPEETFKTELVDFRLETVATDLDAFPFAIQPLPDGNILLTEKVRGLTIIAPDGTQSDPITGTPQLLDNGAELLSLRLGTGWVLDVALHPMYAENGWIYLQHTDICGDACDDEEATMNRLIRGRIVAGQWVDEEVIWAVDKRFYSSMPDIAAGGRIAFDDDGHVYLSIGMKGRSNFQDIQDLGHPAGKIHRVHDDGRIPADNPFVILGTGNSTTLTTDGAAPYTQQTTWTYGHRSPQGLEFNHLTKQLWGTEMGPRGGDEVNLLKAGRNYGWPLYSLGLDYDNTPVEYGKELDIEFNLRDIEQPVVDLTPSPAVSSFVFYEGEMFPQWQHNLIVGTLKATELYRMVVDGEKVVHRETLFSGLARIRDIEVGPEGAIYLLLEHGSGSRIVRMLPDQSRLQLGNLSP